MTALIFWVRHGFHDELGWKLSGRTSDIGLGEAGLEQARAAGRRLRDEKVELVFSSPMTRTRQTAEPIAGACGAPLVVDAGINEIDFGAWSGKEIAELDQRPAFVRWNSGRDYACCEEGESMLEVQARVLRWMEAVIASGRHAVAAVSHADVIKAAVMLTLGLSPRAHDRLEISPGSITCVAGSSWGYRLLSLNETPR
ncbi:histidine phosphatase family protein [Brevundimonas sp.]|uniref:histidine phosphatase family protein n=1 Tax=Brevundimonas sp. TaxID=1871086 RepID=UPI002D661D08|nr:histidine phosphatase family protein [Brevundimonas sp.]HYD27226.1 histidine phosphatase family protein [Brevundimonas sp.]